MGREGATSQADWLEPAEYITVPPGEGRSALTRGRTAAEASLNKEVAHMGMGIAFTFLGLAAVVAPIIWLIWFAADSVGNGPRAVPVPAPGGPSPTPAYFDYPMPADSRRPGRADGITVYNLFGGAPKAYCEGPDAKGACPTARADGTVPCAGCLLVLPEPVRGSRDWHIPAGYRACLVGSYASYRQGPK